ncbi:hypothetical protein [Streptomyces sp. CA-111067]|uniref:hypothetical protein n=1 Tax=Streptomyces sp. CA-111067 TaxID=3240046 RepID=UPI003D96113F
MNTRTFRRAALSMTSVGALVAGLALFSGAAQAGAAEPVTIYYKVGNTNNYTDALEVYYNSNNAGAVALFTGNVPNYAGYTSGSNYYTYIFDTDTAYSGHGQAVKNNVASVSNESSTHDFRVYYNSGYAGPSQLIPETGSSGSATNLNSTLKNENASQKAIAANG